MGNYTKIVMESDTRGRLNISALTDKGAGHGHRIAGPKYIEGGGAKVVETKLGYDDIDALRIYAGIFAEFTLADEPAELHALANSLRRYLRQREGNVYHSHSADLPHHVEGREKTRAALVEACRSLAEKLETADSFAS